MFSNVLETIPHVSGKANAILVEGFFIHYLWIKQSEQHR